MTLRSPRSMLALAAGLLAVVLALFVVALLGARDTDRAEAERDFADKAAVAAALMDGLSARQSALLLTRLPAAHGLRAYLVDDRGHDAVREPGLSRALDAGRASGRLDGGGADRVFAAARVPGSPRRVVLTEPAGVLYAGTGFGLDWLILVALGLAGLLVLALLRRTLRTADDLRDAYERLAGANDELQRANAELGRSNAELEQFASVASHDLQEPLRKVQAFGAQLEKLHGDDLADEAKDFLRRMRGAAERMSTLIEDLLRFSRVTTHARPPSRVDLAQVAREVTADLDAVLEDTGGRVEIGALPTVEADPAQMRQLLQNLIANGLKFHRPGRSPLVTVAPARAGTAAPGRVAFTVTDDGIGFDDADEERIFRVFERLHSRDHYAGTGIGLALCRKIVERHGGTIRGHGRPGAGATFTVVLPLAQPHDDDRLDPAGRSPQAVGA